MSTERKTRLPDQPLDAGQVADFLERHPDFFEQHPELAGKLRIPHGSGTAVSLIEKQVDILRNQNRQLERRLVDIIEVARANEASVDKIHQLATTLFDAADANDVLASAQDALRTRFNAEVVCIGLFRGTPQQLDGGPARRLVRNELEELFGGFLRTGKPLCGRLRSAQLEFLFGDAAERIRSAALMPLGASVELGLLAVGSHNEDQFSPALGTVYLGRIGELLTAALRRHL